MNDSLKIVKPGMDAVISFCKKVYKRYIWHYSLSLDTVRRSRHEKKTTYLHMVISKIETIFCTFLAENNFVNALILFIRARSQYTASTVKRRSTLLCCALCFAVMTSSCTTYRRVHPPSGKHQTTRREPTQRPYTINGKRYEPLSSHQGFEQEGIASSYGRDFHGRTTSNGEQFDMYAMTAAHKTLPMGVYVRVQHKRSGKDVVVRINDRGPFVGDRIIDLSESAAERLGMLREGVAPVKVTALGYRADGQSGSSGYRQPASYDAGTFSLQVASFSVRDNAMRYAGELRKRFGTADVQEARVNGKTYYRVRLGRYSSLSSAQSGREQYGRSGFAGCFVVAVD